MERPQIVTANGATDNLLVLGGYLVVLYLLATAGYNLQGTFMRPGTLRQRIVRFLVAVCAIVAIVFIVTHTVKKGE